MSIQIPAVPEGIANRDNLYNDVYGDLPPLRWNDPEFHARLQWATEGATVDSWYSLTGGFQNDLRASTQVRITVGTTGLDLDVRLVMQNPELVRYLVQSALGAHGMQLTPFPGFAQLYPAKENPVGAVLAAQPWKGRTLYADIGGDAFAVGDKFDTPERTFQKVRFMSKMGTGLFGMTGAEMTNAWEVVYSRA